MVSYVQLVPLHHWESRQLAPFQATEWFIPWITSVWFITRTLYLSDSFYVHLSIYSYILFSQFCLDFLCLFQLIHEKHLICFIYNLTIKFISLLLLNKLKIIKVKYSANIRKQDSIPYGQAWYCLTKRNIAQPFYPQILRSHDSCHQLQAQSFIWISFKSELDETQRMIQPMVTYSSSCELSMIVDVLLKYNRWWDKHRQGITN